MGEMSLVLRPKLLRRSASGFGSRIGRDPNRPTRRPGREVDEIAL
jgi:hypothetical protein